MTVVSNLLPTPLQEASSHIVSKLHAILDPFLLRRLKARSLAPPSYSASEREGAFIFEAP